MKLNNKGYMLIEIILASVLAMVIVYFITDITIKLKNKNDDLLVKTLVSTDQGIIYNTIMEDLYENYDSFNCNNIVISGNTFKYKNFTNIVNKYTEVTNNGCSKSGDTVSIDISLNVKQLPDENYNVVINYTRTS